MMEPEKNAVDLMMEARRMADVDLAIGAIARRCVFIIRGCLRGEELIDAREEFEGIIREGLTQLGLLPVKL